MSGKAHRLRVARANAGFKSASEAARSLGVSPPTYIHHENGTREFGEEAARLYARRFHVSFPWLFLGEGEVQPDSLRAEQEQQRDAEREAQENYERTTTPEERREKRAQWEKEENQRKIELLKTIQLVPVISSTYTKQVRISGYWSRFVGFNEAVYHAIISTWGIPKDQIYYEFGAKADACILYIIVGDAMQPTFSSGDLVLVDTSVSEVEADDIYLISEPTGVPFVRRIQRNLGTNPPTITISSDNPNLSTQVIGVDSILVIGRVAGRIGRT